MRSLFQESFREDTFRSMKYDSKETNSTNYYTICLDVKDRPCVVVGGSDVARRKAASLSDCNAQLKVVSVKLDPVLEYMAYQHEVEWIQRDFSPDDIDGAFLVIAASENRELNQEIARLCKDRGILCNIIDNADASDFINPSAVERGALTIAISTSGISPALAACIRQELEMVYGEEYGAFLEMVARLRPRIHAEFPHLHQRQKIQERMVSSRALSLLRNGLAEEAQRELDRILAEARTDKNLQEGPSLPIV